ncbi:hypothetical protein BH20BAC1_BH20BAC1_19740 [soil metagenome]
MWLLRTMQGSWKIHNVLRSDWFILYEKALAEMHEGRVKTGLHSKCLTKASVEAFMKHPAESFHIT